MTVEIEPEKTCGTCSLLCMRVDQIVEKVDKQEVKLDRQEGKIDDLQRRLLSMEIRISTTVSIAVGIVTILANYFSK